MFKKIGVLAAIFSFAIISASTVYAVPKNSLTVQPIGFLFGNGNLEYEGVISESNAIAGRINYSSWNIGDWNTSAIGGGLSYRFFPTSQEAPKGFWFGPGGDILIMTSTYNNETASSTFISIGGEAGYKWVWGEEIAFVLSPSLNLRYIAGSLEIGDSNLPFGGLTFGLGLAVGIAF